MKYLLPSGESIMATVLLLSLCLFFFGLLVWVFRRRGREIYERLALLPLEGDERDAKEMKAHG